MTKEITKAFILQEMQDKFKLREFVPDVFTFSEQVVPVYNIEQHIEEATQKKAVVSITSATGFLLLNVPPTERWSLNGYTVIFTGAGAFTVSGIYVVRKASPAYLFYLDLTAGQTVSYTHLLPVPLRLHPGDSLRVLVDGYTSTQDIWMYADYIKEELR